MDEPSSWSDRLSRVDVERECTAGASVEDSCWLCDHLDDWNSVLGAVQFRLVEEKPGKLCLCTQAPKSPDDFNRNEFPYNPVFITAWLPRKHWCVEKLYLKRCDLYTDGTAVPGPFPGLRPSGLRKISIKGFYSPNNGTFDWACVLDAAGPLEQLQRIYCQESIISDSLASKLAKLISASASSVTKLSFSGCTNRNCASDVLVSGISNCKMLRVLQLGVSISQDSLNQLINHLQSMETLEVLHLREDCYDGDDDDEEEGGMFALFDHEHKEKDLPCVGDLLRKSTSLKEFRFEALTPHAIIDCLEALESNTVLREVVINGHHCAKNRIGYDMGLSLRSMLAKNRGLRLLTLVSFRVDYEAAVLISMGLQENSTLERLCMSSSQLLFPAEQALYHALKTNTVVQLRLDYASCSTAERLALSAEVDKNSWYRRISMKWDESHAVGLSKSLLDQSLCPAELCLDTSCFSDESFARLCIALSSSIHVRELAVILSCASPTKVTSLHNMLSENKSLRCLSLGETSQDARGSSILAAQGLCFSDSVADLLMKFGDLDAMLVELVALLLETNESLCKVTLLCSRKLEPEYVDAISRALLLNRFITTFRFFHGPKKADCSTLCSRRAVQCNVARLHRAVRFVLLQDLGKACAEAFELFEKKASLVPRLMSTSKMTQAQAEAAVKTARHFISTNYLVVTGVVSQKLECYAADSTQIDQLNGDCWRAITRYLMVSDVVDNRYC